MIGAFFEMQNIFSSFNINLPKGIEIRKAPLSVIMNCVTFENNS